MRSLTKPHTCLRPAPNLHLNTPVLTAVLVHPVPSLIKTSKYISCYVLVSPLIPIGPKGGVKRVQQEEKESELDVDDQFPFLASVLSHVTKSRRLQRHQESGLLLTTFLLCYAMLRAVGWLDKSTNLSQDSVVTPIKTFIFLSLQEYSKGTSRQMLCLDLEMNAAITMILVYLSSLFFLYVRKSSLSNSSTTSYHAISLTQNTCLLSFCSGGRPRSRTPHHHCYFTSYPHHCSVPHYQSRCHRSFLSYL